MQHIVVARLLVSSKRNGKQVSETGSKVNSCVKQEVVEGGIYKCFLRECQLVNTYMKICTSKT